MLETGELARLIEEDAVVGVTSNPTIFEKALATGDWYDDQLRAELDREVDVVVAARALVHAATGARIAWANGLLSEEACRAAVEACVRLMFSGIASRAS